MRGISGRVELLLRLGEDLGVGKLRSGCININIGRPGVHYLFLFEVKSFSL